MKVVFMGTPDFSVPALRALQAAGHEIVAVYSQPPRAAGRGKKERPTAVHRAALDLGLNVRTPTSLKSDDAQADFAALGAEIGVVVAYGLILPQAILDAPTHGCLNIHASLLPRWRGAAPIHRAIMAGDAKTGVGIMQMEAGLDTGPVLLERETVIGLQETTGDLHDRLSDIGAEAICDALARLSDLAPCPQPEGGVTYASKIDKAEARIDWTAPADTVDRQIRGLSPFPGAWTYAHENRLKFLRSTLTEGAGKPGAHLGEFRIACGSGAVQILEAQRQGKAPLPAAEFLKGFELPDYLD